MASNDSAASAAAVEAADAAAVATAEDGAEDVICAPDSSGPMCDPGCDASSPQVATLPPCPPQSPRGNVRHNAPDGAVPPSSDGDQTLHSQHPSSTSATMVAHIAAADGDRSRSSRSEGGAGQSWHDHAATADSAATATATLPTATGPVNDARLMPPPPSSTSSPTVIPKAPSPRTEDLAHLATIPSASTTLQHHPHRSPEVAPTMPQPPHGEIKHQHSPLAQHLTYSRVVPDVLPTTAPIPLSRLKSQIDYSGALTNPITSPALAAASWQPAAPSSATYRPLLQSGPPMPPPPHSYQMVPIVQPHHDSGIFMGRSDSVYQHLGTAAEPLPDQIHYPPPHYAPMPYYVLYQPSVHQQGQIECFVPQAPAQLHASAAHFTGATSPITPSGYPPAPPATYGPPVVYLPAGNAAPPPPPVGYFSLRRSPAPLNQYSPPPVSPTVAPATTQQPPEPSASPNPPLPSGLVSPRHLQASSSTDQPAAAPTSGRRGRRSAAAAVDNSGAAPPAVVRRRSSRKPYLCPEPGCDKTFTRRYNLQSHLRCHAGNMTCGGTLARCTRETARTFVRTAISHSPVLYVVMTDALKRHLSSEAKRCDAAGIPFTMPTITSDSEASDGAAGADDRDDDLDDDKGSGDGDGDTYAHAAADLAGSPPAGDAGPFDALAAAAAAAPRAAG
ncbi:hypothetical protein HK405_003081 [Cladochytrium tenue]|nr:hypothetical protein HK405_003081 [Cladochytrium tenue]